MDKQNCQRQLAIVPTMRTKAQFDCVCWANLNKLVTKNQMSLWQENWPHNADQKLAVYCCCRSFHTQNKPWCHISCSFPVWALTHSNSSSHPESSQWFQLLLNLSLILKLVILQYILNFVIFDDPDWYHRLDTEGTSLRQGSSLLYPHHNQCLSHLLII